MQPEMMTEGQVLDDIEDMGGNSPFCQAKWRV